MTFITDIVSTNVLEARISAIKYMAMLSARVEGAASLAWGLPSFRTPEYIRRGVKQYLDEDPDAGKYTLPDGLPELRELVVAKHKAITGIDVDADENVMITAGNMQGLNTHTPAPLGASPYRLSTETSMSENCSEPAVPRICTHVPLWPI